MTRPTAAFLLLLAAGCGSDQAGPGASHGNFSVINGVGAGGTIKVYLDGVFAADVAAGERGARLTADPGIHRVELRRADGSGSAGRQVTLQADMPMTVVAWDSLGFLSPAVLEDSNSVVAPGSSKLRVAHFAALAGRIDIWRTQPDYGTPIRLMFPFNYRDISPFVESTPGAWRVLVSSAIDNPVGAMPDTLAMTGSVVVAGGEARTVVIVDRPGGGIEALVVEP